MIDIKNLSLSYDKEKVLDDINLHIPKNSTYAIIGPSGCGKTSLLHVMAGLIKPTRGQLMINGTEINDTRKSTGIILQDLGLLPWKRVWDNAALGLLARDVDKVMIKERLESILLELSLLEHRDKFPHELSGGQKQRVAIARTLVLEPDLLLLDEASSSLDNITKEQLQDLILDLYKKNPMTMVMITHSIEEAVFLGQKIVVMEKARIKKIIDNPSFGEKDIRLKDIYFNLCKEVRRWLYQ